MNMKVIAYLRVSTEQQADEGVSLAAQRAKAEQFAELYDHEVVCVIEDEGASGRSLNRPGLQKALGMLEAGEAEGLLIAKLDRLTRSVGDMAALVQNFFSSRYSLLSVADQIDSSSASGRLVLNVLTSVAAWEAESCAERTSAALRYKQSQGEYIGGIPLGYERDGLVLKPVEAEQEIVSRILSMREAGATLRSIAETLNEEEVPTKKGGRWYASTVSHVIKREEAA